MNSIQISDQGDAADSPPFNRLPDEIILQILNKLIDLKTLCFCHLVSRRFSSIVLQVHTVSYTAPLLNPPNSDKNTSDEVDAVGFPMKLIWSLINGVVFNPLHLLRRMVVPTSKPLSPIISSFYGASFRSAALFLSKFRELKCLSMELPSSRHRGIDNSSLFKWKVKFGNRIESFLLLSPNSICDTNGLYADRHIEEEEEEEDGPLNNDVFKQDVHIAFQCLKDAIVRHKMLLYFIKDLPTLEKVSITDSGKRGSLCLSRGELAEVRECIHSTSDSVKPQPNPIEVPVNVSTCYVPVLKLPVSGYDMKGVTLVVMHMNNHNNNIQGVNDYFMNSEDGFEDKEEAAYNEALLEIMKIRKDRMMRLL